MYLEDAIKLMHNMSSVRRYSQTKLVNEESILEHTGFVGCISLFIGMKIIQGGDTVNMEVLFAKSMIHDMEEVGVGDIPRPTKYFNGQVKSALAEVESAAMLDIQKTLRLDDIYEYWRSAKNSNTGSIVAAADAIAVVYKAYQEIHIFGNKAIANHIDGLKDHIATLIRSDSHEVVKILLREAIRLLIELEEEL